MVTHITTNHVSFSLMNVRFKLTEVARIRVFAVPLLLLACVGRVSGELIKTV